MSSEKKKNNNKKKDAIQQSRVAPLEEGLLLLQEERKRDEQSQEEEPPPPPPPDLLATFARARSLFGVLYTGWGLFAAGGALTAFLKPGDVAKLPLIFLNLVAPSLLSVLVLQVQRIATNLYRMPYIWDMDY